MDLNGCLVMILLLAGCTQIGGAGYCAPGSQVIKPCTDGNVTGSRLFFDVGGRTVNDQSCLCQLTTSVTKIIGNLIEAPGYESCGISVQFFGDSKIMYTCIKGSTFIGKSPTRPISIIANKSAVNYEIPYCLMLQIPHEESGVMSLSCQSKPSSTTLSPTSKITTLSPATTKPTATSSTILPSSPTTQTQPHTVQTQTESSVISTTPLSEDVKSTFLISSTTVPSTTPLTSSKQLDATSPTLQASGTTSTAPHLSRKTDIMSTKTTHQYTTITISAKTDLLTTIQQSEITPTSTMSALLMSSITQSSSTESTVKISSSTNQKFDTTSVTLSTTNYQSTSAASTTPFVTSSYVATTTTTPKEGISPSASDSDNVNNSTYTEDESQTRTTMMQMTSIVDETTASIESNHSASAISSQSVNTDSTDNNISVTTESIVKTTQGSSRKNDGIIAVAVIGTLIGVGLIVFLIGAIYYKNRQRRKGSYSGEKSAYLNYAADIDAEGVMTSTNGNAGNTYPSSETPQIIPYDEHKSL